MGADDRILVAAARTGNSQALEELIARYRGRVTSLVRGLLGDGHDAEDVCQETLLAASTDLESLRDDSRFGAWLMAIAVHKTRSFQRKRVRESEARENIPPRAPRLSERDQTELNLTLGQALATLPEDQRMALNLRYHSGLRYAEIAAIMDVPTSTVRGIIFRGTQQLRRHLKPSLQKGS